MFIMTECAKEIKEEEGVTEQGTGQAGSQERGAGQATKALI